MVEEIGKKLQKNPFFLIVIFVSISILASLILSIFPQIMLIVFSLGGLGNFTFSSMFVDDSVVKIFVSALMFFAFVTILGVKMTGGSNR